MTHRLAPDAALTDSEGGRLVRRSTGRGVTATPLVRRIAAHLERGLDWTDFPGAGGGEAETALETMRAAGLVFGPGDEADMAGLTRPDRTMFEVPFRHPADLRPGEYAFVGAPVDIGATGFPGARFGRAALRQAGAERFQCRIDLGTGRMAAWTMPSMGGGILGGARLSDLGDVPHMAGEPAEGYLARLRSVIDRVYAAGAVPVVLGGDHSVTYATLPRRPATLLHLDAHCDLAERVSGHCHHHGNVLRRVLDEGLAAQIHHFGLRDLGGWEPLGAGTHAKSAGDMERDGWAEAIAGHEVFVSLDLDVLDPSVLPGTGTPVVGGLSLRQLCQALALIVRTTRPGGLDVVELCPLRDPSGQSERVAVEAILVFLGLHHRLHGPTEAPGG